MRPDWSRGWLRLLLLIGAGLLGSAGLASAVLLTGTATASTVIQGCQSNATGLLRVVSNNQTQCLKKLETPVSWNIQGPAGPIGPAGAPGPKGSTGASGANGAPGITSVQTLTVGDSSCPAGGVRFFTSTGSYPFCNGTSGTNGRNLTNTVTTSETVTNTITTTETVLLPTTDTVTQPTTVVTTVFVTTTPPCSDSTEFAHSILTNEAMFATPLVPGLTTPIGFTDCDQAATPPDFSSQAPGIGYSLQIAEDAAAAYEVAIGYTGDLFVGAPGDPNRQIDQTLDDLDTENCAGVAANGANGYPGLVFVWQTVGNSYAGTVVPMATSWPGVPGVGVGFHCTTGSPFDYWY